MRQFPRRSLFSEQQAFAWQRLLLLHGEDRAAEDLTTEEQARLLWAFLWIPDAVLDPDLDVDERLTGWEPTDERLLRFFVSNGGLAGHAAFKHELARAHNLYHVIANSRAARRHLDYCPIDEWLAERYGANFVELQTLGFAFFARSNVGDRSGGQLLFTNEEYFAGTGLATRYSQRSRQSPLRTNGSRPNSLPRGRVPAMRHTSSSRSCVGQRCSSATAMLSSSVSVHSRAG